VAVVQEILHLHLQYKVMQEVAVILTTTHGTEAVAEEEEAKLAKMTAVQELILAVAVTVH
jgi:hypothetical protein